jgi:outer membrane lipoprotein-sorting protein
MNIKIQQWLFILFTSLITMAVLSGLALASEFSAEIIMKGGPMSGKGRVWVKGHKMRQEFGGQFGKMITIMDLDQGVNWVLMPESKTYLKNKIKTKDKGFRPENFMGMQQGHMKAQIKLVGTETVNGYACDKYLITFENKKMGTMTQWFSKKLNYPIKMINKSAQMGEMATELHNIKRGGVKDDLFKIPLGYKEMQQPMIPQMPIKN